MFDFGLRVDRLDSVIGHILGELIMCIGENDSPRFIRRRKAATEFMQKLLDEGYLSEQQAIGATSDKFSLRTDNRDDYRIYKTLWNLIGD